MATAAHTALKTTLKCLGKKKETRTQAMLGYTIEELRLSIESHPNWLKVKNEIWSIDHIFPIKAFCDFGITDIRLINSLDNLQPALLKDNISKSAKYDIKIFVEWLRGKGHEIS